MTRIRQFLAAPVFEDEDKTRVAGLLNAVLLTMLALTIIVGFFSPIAYPDPVPMLVAVGVAVPLWLGGLFLTRRGRVRLASMFLSSTMCVIVTLVAVAFGGVRTAAFSTFVSVVLVAGLLLGGRAAFGFAGLSALVGLGMLYAETNGVLLSPVITGTPVSAWVALTVNFILAAVLLHLATRSIANALERARRNERALVEANERLQREITERRRVGGAIERRAAQLALLNDISGKITAVLDLDSVLDRATHLVQESFGYHHVALFTIDHERGELVMRARSGEFVNLFPSEHRIKLDQGMIGWVGRHGKKLLANDVDAEPHYVNFFADVIPTRSELSVPIRVGEEILGALDAQSPQLNAFDENDVMVMETLADQIAVAIENARLYEAVQQELTERKRAEEALRESESNLKQAQQIAHLGSWALDLETEEFTVSEEMTHIYKYEDKYTGSVSMEEFAQYIYPGDRERVSSALNNAIVGKAPYNLEFRIVRTDGQVRVLHAQGDLMRDESGKPVKIVGTGLDITERKRAERVLQMLNEAALAMQRALTPEEIFAAVTEEFKKLGLSCMVFPTDESQSKLFTRYLSYETKALKTAEKLVGLQREDFSIPIESRDAYRQVVWGKKTVFVGNAEEIARQLLPKHLKRFAGQLVRTVKVSKAIAAPLIVEDKVIGVLSVQSDDLTEADTPAITAFAHQMAAAWHKAQLMQDLQSTLDELKRTQAQLVQAQKMEAIGTLAGGIAHDFNNLLTSIGGFTELLLREAPEGSQQYEDLHQVKVAAERAAALTRQLRLFTRQEKGERRPTQLNNVVEETRDLLERSIPKEITIELHLEPELWAVEANPSQMSQVLMNLCVNARDAMPDGGTLTLETRNVILGAERAQATLAAAPGRYVRLSVSDTGCGMSPEVQARLFEPFFTTKEVGRGTGLGLAVVYGIVRGHEGFITVYSEEGQGSTFRVYLPAIGLAVEESEVEVSELPTGAETILLVDDEETVRKLGQRILEGCGYTVLMAANGFQALEVYQTHQGEIALVVLDVVMPQMGGRECLRQLRQSDPQVRVLISTGYTANSSAQGLVSEGALGVVEKPFLPHDFAIAVRMALDKA